MLFRTSSLRRFATSGGMKPGGTGVLTQRVHVPNNEVLGFWVIVVIVQVLGKYMIIRYLDPEGPHGRDRDRRARPYEDERRAPSNDGGGGKGDQDGEMREGKGKNAKDGGKARKGHDDPAPDPDEKGFRVQT